MYACCSHCSWRFCCRRQEAREREERIASARSFLEKMPELLTSEPDSAKMMENLRNWVRVLVHADNLQLLKADSALGTAYNKGLCKALLAAAVHGRSEAIPELMGVLRCATDQQASCAIMLPVDLPPS